MGPRPFSAVQYFPLRWVATATSNHLSFSGESATTKKVRKKSYLMLFGSLPSPVWTKSADVENPKSLASESDNTFFNGFWGPFPC